MKRHIVFYSSGISSWGAAKAAVAQHGSDEVLLLFADTKIEDPSNYVFLEESAQEMGCELIRIEDGRNPFELWKDQRAIANNRMAFCSRILKQDVCRRWVKENAPKNSVFYVGIGWDETHRLPAIRKAWSKWGEVKAPLAEPPFIKKEDLIKAAKALGLTPPRLYDLGLPHANCGGGCVRAGISQWRHVYEALPEIFSLWEREEKEARERLGKDVAILRSRKGGQSRPYPLYKLREDIEAQDHSTLNMFDWKGCGCFTEDTNLAL